jgi:nucleotide sugar dehydrogenase
MGKIKVGIAGLGFVGGAINNFLKDKENIELFIYDKYKKINDFKVLLETDLLFVCLPTLYDDSEKKYDMKEIDNTLFELKNNEYHGIILIKSTVLPDYCKNQNNIYPSLKIIHNPEFLTARTAFEDFINQKNIILGYTKQSFLDVDKVNNFYKELFPSAKISINTSEESALVKLGCNSFYAVKIQYFTELYLLCQKLNISYESIKNMMLDNEWINPMHTKVPGHDNQISFGGGCLPKDISALSEYMKKLEVPNKVISSTIVERNIMREP